MTGKKTTARILLYVHYNKNDRLDDHVMYQLQQMKSIFSKIVFISNSKISAVDKKRLNGLHNQFIQRENRGFDFAAWHDGLLKIGWEELKNYDLVTLMNDTCFGPIYPLEPIYEKMDAKKIDFWGMTNHIKTTSGMPKTNGPIPEHMQSYFMVFDKKVVRSRVFRNFWDNIKNYDKVESVIQQYETQLTSLLKNNNFKYEVIFDAKKHNVPGVYDFSVFRPLLAIEKGVPFLKIKSFTYTLKSNILGFIKKHSDYPVDLIESYLKNINLEIYKPISVTKKTKAFLYNKAVKSKSLVQNLLKKF